MSDSEKYASLANLSREKFDSLLEQLRKKNEISRLRLVRQEGERKTFPLSFAQQRLWFLDRLAPGNSAYNIPAIIRLKGKLDVNALRRALEEVIRRHEILRTSFSTVEGQPVQLISDSIEIQMPVIDLRNLSQEQRDKQAQELAKREADRAFDLSRGPLLRASLLRMADEEHIFVVVIHHIVSDGWSVGILIKEMAERYEGSEKGEKEKSREERIEYGDYAVWQREYLRGEVEEELIGYWKKELRGIERGTELPADRARPPVQSFRGARYFHVLPRSLTRELKEMSRREGVTMYVTMLAAFKVLLHRYTGDADIIVGTPIACRNRSEIESLIGYFANTLVIRADLSGDPTFREAQKRVFETVLTAQAHQELPFERLVEELHPERNLSYNPLFRVLFGFQNTPAPSLKLSGLESSTVKVDGNASRFDLSLDLSEDGECISAIFEYSTDLFEAATIARMAGHFQTLLESITADPDERISTFTFLTGAERRQLLVEWNTAQIDQTGRDKHLLHELFEAQARRLPDSIAVASEAEKLTYDELNRRANQLANHLMELGVGPEALVGIFLERSIDMIVGLLGILKAGGAYVPIDPAYPKERISLILEDAKVAVIVTKQGLLNSLPKQNARTICLDTDRATIAKRREENPGAGATADNLAYVIYTSGSTGQPKGVQITHASVTHLVEVTRPLFDFSEDDVWTVFHSYAFDFSVWEIWSPLILGGKLVIVPLWITQSPERFYSLLNTERVTVLNQTPSAIRQLVGAKPEAQDLALKLIVCGGEPFPKELVPQLDEWETPVWNFYGPTETTVWAAAKKTSTTETDDGMVAIGSPLSDMQIYLLDQRNQLVPVGVPGEIHIGGLGLARGYLQRPDLTAEKFIPNPFGAEPGSRLYKTGDLARRLVNGDIEFLGRLDQQVKIRGFRVELGEIEAALSQHPTVREAVVIVRDSKDQRHDKRLVAYVVADQKQVPTISELRSFLKEKLPDYMIPYTVVFLDALPLSPNRKIDRLALPEPADVRPELAAAYVMPQTETERAIAAIWQDALQLESVGAHDNFFDLGGHSLLLIQVHNKLQALFSRDLTVVDLFKYPTVSSLAVYLNEAANATSKQAKQPAQLYTTNGKQTGENGSNDIAIIGMSGRFPGAENLEKFWQNLAEGIESITFLSDAALEAAGVAPDSLRQPNYVKATSLLEGVELFDAAFFGFNHREAELLDPQHRLFLECSWEAIESAGYDTETYKGRIGVFAGSGLNSYGLLNLFSNPEVIESVGNLQALVASDKDYLSTRVSYKLNLRGPSVNVNTACSTSLVAVHLACQSLLNGDCHMALAGGVSIKVPQKTGYFLQPGGVMSPDGHCRAFDAEAAGTIFGSGVGLVVLKKLNDALADGDHIYAVIKGSAINNDGSLKVGYTAPSVEGQAEVVSEALAKAGVHPETISYIETHGTGTHLGDPIEVAALTQAFRAWTEKKEFCRIGSVKTNIGHLDTAAGMAGLIKTVLSLKHKMIPPSLHFERPNPKIDFENSPFYVNASLTEWKTNGTLRRAAASSFGVGGTNAHIIFEEPSATMPSGGARDWQLLMLSAKTESALEQATANLSAHLKKFPGINLADVAYTLQVGRREFQYRRMLICRDREDALNALETRDPKKRLTGWAEPVNRPVAFMFPGLGDQYVNMASGLYKTEQVFREQVDACCEFLKPHLGIDLREVIYPVTNPEPESSAIKPRIDLRKMLRRDDELPDENAERLNQTHLTQPSVFIIEFALAKLYEAWGIHPQALIGYSIGEYVAACLSGVLSLEDALLLVAKRAQMIQELPEGAMLAVPLPENQVSSLLGNELSLSAINGLSLCVVSGPPLAVAELENELAGRGLTCRRLRTSHAFHSKMMEPIVERFVEMVRSIRLNSPAIPYISNVTGTWITAAESTDPYYWARHLCEAVRFADGVCELWKEPGRVLLEVGPGQSLSSLAIQQAESDSATPQVALASLPHFYDSQSDTALLLKTLGQLWLLGKKVDWQSFYAAERRCRVPLPTYPFERQQYWIEPRKNAIRQDARRANSEIKTDGETRLYLQSWKRSIPPEFFERQNAANEKLTYMVFTDALGLGSQLSKRLREEGHHVIKVIAGRGFEKLTDSFTLNPQCFDDYCKLFEAVNAEERIPATIIHLWSIAAANKALTTSDAFEECQRLGYHSLIFCAQALKEQGIKKKIRLAVVTNDVQEVTGEESVRPEKATVLGPCQVIPQINPNISCHSIDIALPETSDGRDLRLLDQLLLDLTSSAPDATVAFRGDHRWVHSYEAIRLGENSVSSVRLRERGAYLILEGLDGHGLALAEFLARQMRAKLVLVTRSASTMPAFETLEQFGSDVLIVNSDLADKEQMRAVVDQANQRFGSINGVVYSAYSDGFKYQHSLQIGALEFYVLEEVLKDTKLDFCILLSPFLRELSESEMIAQLSANFFMNAFARRQKMTARLPWMSVTWDSPRSMESNPSNNGNGIPSHSNITADERVKIFQRILSMGSMSPVFVSRSDLSSTRDGAITCEPFQISLTSADSKPSFTFHSRANARNPYVAPSTDTERGIAVIWQELLGVEQVGIHDNFFELGGHSLLATRLISRLKKALPIEMTLRTVYEAPVLCDLALVLEDLLIARLEELSEDEARKLVSSQALTFKASE